VQSTSKFVFSPSQAALGCVFGGPLAAAYFIRHNFKALGQEQAVRKTVNIGSFIVIVVICMMPLLPKEFPSILLNLPAVIFARYFIENKQFTKQQIEDDQTLVFQSVNKVVGVSVICLCISLALVFALALFLAFSAGAA